MAAPGDPRGSCRGLIVAAGQLGQQTRDNLGRATREREGRRDEDGQGLGGYIVSSGRTETAEDETEARPFSLGIVIAHVTRRVSIDRASGLSGEPIQIPQIAARV